MPLLPIHAFFLLTLLSLPCLPFPVLPSGPRLLITVKTTLANHENRVKEAMDTWAGGNEQTNKYNSILFVSDSGASSGTRKWPPILNSGCQAGHQNEALCCKLAFELRLALDQQPDFFCHFDDDSFVLLANLRALLSNFPPNQDLYLGRASTAEPISLNAGSKSSSARAKDDQIVGRMFWFGTGGAGFCLSRSTLNKLHLFVIGDRFERLCALLGVPDDVTLGFVLGNLLGVPLTNSDKFHSHLERLDAIPENKIATQISLSGAKGNLVNLPEIFSLAKDPLRFRSLHYFLFNR